MYILKLYKNFIKQYLTNGILTSASVSTRLILAAVVIVFFTVGSSSATLAFAGVTRGCNRALAFVLTWIWITI